MDGSNIYLDNNATTCPLLEVRMAMLDALECFYGNASSAHSVGQKSRIKLAESRECVAKLLGVQSEQLVFTSSGSEANNQVIRSVLSDKPIHIITSTVEHSSILNTCKYLEQTQRAEVTYLRVDRDGAVDLDELEHSFKDRTSLVSIQWANNETGVIQDVYTIGAICRDRGVSFHTDAAQAIGKLSIEIGDLPIDFATCTAHKIHGPQGVGAIYLKNPGQLKPLIFGGPQEMELRAGTENMPGIVGFGVAAMIRSKNFTTSISNMQQLRDLLETKVKKLIPRIRINGYRVDRICNTSNILFPDIEGFSLVAQLDRKGIQCSQSSACTNQRPEPSYVLREMGLTEQEAYSSIRFCTSFETSAQDIMKTADCIFEVWQNLTKV